MDLQLVLVVVISIVAVWALLLVLFWVLRPKGVPVREVLRVIPDLLRMLRAIVSDDSVPKDVRFVVGGLFIWIVSPIDLIPEFLPAIGPLDDVIVAVVALRYVRRRMGTEQLRARWSGSADGFAVLERVIGKD